MDFSINTLDLEPASSQASFRSTHSDDDKAVEPQQPPNQMGWAAANSVPSPPQPTRVGRTLSHTEETAVDSLLAMQLSRGRTSSCEDAFVPAFCFSGVAPGALAAR